MDPDSAPTPASTVKEIRERIVSSRVRSSDVDLEKTVIIIIALKLIDDCSGKETSLKAEPRVAQFPTLNPHEKHLCLTAACGTMLDYVKNIRRARKTIKDSNLCYPWRRSYLNNEELAMIGELDGKEAENIYKGSQENHYEDVSFGDLVNSYYFSERLSERLKSGFRLPDFRVSSYRGERFFDEHIVFDDTTEAEDGVILEDHVKREMLLGRSSYLMRMQEAMRIGKFINKSHDEGAGSETKFHQSDDQKRKEKLKKKKVPGEEAMLRKRIGKFINKSHDEGAGSGTKFHQSDEISGKTMKQRIPEFVW